MTTDKNFKRLVRERMTATGDRYTAAHAAVVKETPERVRQLLVDFERAGAFGPERADKEHLLGEALRLIESAGDRPSGDLVHVAHRVLLHQWDIPARLRLFDKYLAQPLPVEEEAWARWERADSMAVLGAMTSDHEWHRRAVEAQAELGRWVEENMSATQLPWVWHDSTMAGSWLTLGRTDDWVAMVKPVIEHWVAVPENRTDRYELLNTAASIYDTIGLSEEVDAALEAMRVVLTEDPDWHERQWAEDRLHKQNVGRALRAGDRAGMRRAAGEYQKWIESQDPPLVPSPLGDIAFLFLLAEDYETAIHYCERCVAEGDPFPFTFVWYAAAVMGQSRAVEHAADLLREARRRMSSEEVLSVFRQRPEVADYLEDERLLEAIAP